ncbi:hypothetical protein CcrC1_gp143 [Caulobacter phage C1]|nr:hypothetical protein CcrC1_gp143 [Caulobacter phage C1]UTU08372.1 hypothetical protein CcrC2_gp144 [Caulobacter phage C2]UTU08889.1 hypothetical protein CcrJ4_gp138 [Caulobacter phage J4]UTU09445.1 hypothetical protein CcrBL47_gp159 [Caulobacter phage BL47]UTU10005.1 hypothetical protein CcrRB23_gp143 [Caulobacter phage RB23]WGN97030.1 hypothetical protein [Bertelyvirus sp.]
MAHAHQRPPEAASEETEQTPQRTNAMKTLIERLRAAHLEAEAERVAQYLSAQALEA